MQDDMVQRDCYLLSLVRKGLSRKYLESGFSITVSGSGKKISQQEGPTQNERGVPEMLREYGRNLPVINTLAGKAAPPRPGQDTELSLCDGKPWEISGRSSMINGLTKKKKYAGPLDGNCILKASTEMGHWDMVHPTKQMTVWAEFCSARVKTDGGNVIDGLGRRTDHTSGWTGCSI